MKKPEATVFDVHNVVGQVAGLLRGGFIFRAPRGIFDVILRGEDTHQSRHDLVNDVRHITACDLASPLFCRKIEIAVVVVSRLDTLFLIVALKVVERVIGLVLN